MSLEGAVSVLLENIAYDPPVECLPLDEAMARVSARDIYAPIDLPPFARSPLDGYAVRAEDTTGASREHPAVLEIIEEQYAGMMADVSIQAGQAVRLATGSPIPSGADCIVRQEDTDCGGGEVRIYVPHSPLQNYCPKGADLQQGNRCVRQGDLLNPSRIGILAGLGLDRVQVFGRPTVGVLATGDELTNVGAPLQAGKIYNSNQYFLSARLRELGCRPQVFAPCGDNAAQIAQAVDAGLESVDLMITTGGVSVGKRDFLPEVCCLLNGRELFKGVSMKPGSPAMAFIHRGKCVLALSGNPFAAAATFELLARPVLARMEGLSMSFPRRTTGVLQDAFPKFSRGRRFIRASFDGGKVFLPKGGAEVHSSGSLASLGECNCMIDIPANTKPLVPGQEVALVLIQ